MCTYQPSVQAVGGMHGRDLMPNLSDMYMLQTTGTYIDGHFTNHADNNSVLYPPQTWVRKQELIGNPACRVYRRHHNI